MITICKLLFWLIIATISFGASCARKTLDHAQIGWAGSNKLEEMSWTINGESVGSGLEGYQAILSHLESLHHGAVVTITYPGELWNEDVEGYVLHDIFPFRSHETLRKHFQELMLRQDLGIRRKAL
jgi:hypothetical protein